MKKLLEKYDLLRAGYEYICKKKERRSEKNMSLRWYFNEVVSDINDIILKYRTLESFIDDIQWRIDTFGEKSIVFEYWIVLLQELKEIKKGE